MAPPVQVVHPDRVGTHKRAFGGDHFDVVADQLVASHVDLMAYHPIRAEQEVLHRDVLLDRIRRAVDAAFTISGQVKGGLTERFAGDSARVDAYATDHGFAFDDGNA